MALKNTYKENLTKHYLKNLETIYCSEKLKKNEMGKIRDTALKIYSLILKVKES